MTRAADDDTLAKICDVLSQATARAGPDARRERLFLAKLALLLARESGDPARVAALAEIALRDLD